MDERELLILNSPVDQNADSDELSLIDIIFAAKDVPISAEDTVFNPGSPLVVNATRTNGG
ncbi:hypothetical protein [Desulfoscipio gibsoniae]